MDGEIDWQARAERAEAACAEMRSVLSDIENTCQQTAVEAAEVGHSDGPYLWGRVRDRLRLTLSSTSCGLGYVRREELEAAKAESAEARSNVEKCLRELSDIVRERDAAKAEVERLREALRTIFDVACGEIQCKREAALALAGKEGG